jgi:hypothetical protein
MNSAFLYPLSSVITYLTQVAERTTFAVKSLPPQGGRGTMSHAQIV